MKKIFNFTTDKEEILEELVSQRKFIEQFFMWYLPFGKKKSKIVFTNGCFDLIHPQHVNLLNKSKELGCYLIVGMNSDKSVKLLKGEDRPIFNEEDRAYMLSNLVAVDCVIIFDDHSVLDLIKFIKPDVMTKGDDYNVNQLEDVGGNFVKEYGGKIELVPTKKGLATSDIINKIIKLQK
jgi:rfaE bifunctional protein nucleotidyltransferase chain/domain